MAFDYRDLLGLAQYRHSVESADILRDSQRGENVDGRQQAVNQQHDATIDQAAARYRTWMNAQESDFRQAMAFSIYGLAEQIGSDYTYQTDTLATAKQQYTEQLAELFFDPSEAVRGLEELLAEDLHSYDSSESSNLVTEMGALVTYLANNNAVSLPWGEFLQSVSSSRQSLLFDRLATFAHDQRLDVAELETGHTISVAHQEKTRFEEEAESYLHRRLAELGGALGEELLVGIGDRDLPSTLTAPDFSTYWPYSRISSFPTSFAGSYDGAFSSIIGGFGGWYGWGWIGFSSYGFYATGGGSIHVPYVMNYHVGFRFSPGYTGGLFGGYSSFGLGWGSSVYGWGFGSASAWGSYGGWNGLWGTTGFWNSYGYQARTAATTGGVTACSPPSPAPSPAPPRSPSRH